MDERKPMRVINTHAERCRGVDIVDDPVLGLFNFFKRPLVLFQMFDNGSVEVLCPRIGNYGENASSRDWDYGCGAGKEGNRGECPYYREVEGE